MHIRPYKQPDIATGTEPSTNGAILCIFSALELLYIFRFDILHLSSKKDALFVFHRFWVFIWTPFQSVDLSTIPSTNRPVNQSNSQLIKQLCSTYANAFRIHAVSLSKQTGLSRVKNTSLVCRPDKSRR